MNGTKYEEHSVYQGVWIWSPNSSQVKWSPFQAKSNGLNFKPSHGDQIPAKSSGTQLHKV
ncbi:unnamed protein product [Prunus armeniaca]